MKCFKLLGIAVLLCGFTAAGLAQTLQESTESRNKGVELINNGDIEGAITELEKTVDISKKVGPEADENKQAAESVLPGLYLQKADKILNTKDYDAALKAFQETITASEKYNDPETKAKAEKPLPMVYYAKGATDFQNNSYDNAIKSLDQATTLDPDLAKAYYIKGAIYQKQKDEAKMAENYTLAYQKGEDSDKATAKNAKNALSRYYFNDGITALKAKKTDDAIKAFSKTVEVDDTNADAYQRLASCYNTKKQWDDAISNAEKALENKKGDDAAFAGIYYELGNAYAGKKDTGKACESFKKALHGPYADAAKYQIETALKCK